MQDFAEALELAGLVENDMSDIEKWMKETALDLNRRIKGGFPSDVDGELKWNKVILSALTSGNRESVYKETRGNRW